MLEPREVSTRPVAEDDSHSLHVLCHAIEVRARASGHHYLNAALRQRRCVAIEGSCRILVELRLHMEDLICVDRVLRARTVVIIVRVGQDIERA